MTISLIAAFAAPIVVVAREDQITAALETDEFIRAGADWVLKPLITVLVRSYLAANESVFSTDARKLPKVAWLRI